MILGIFDNYLYTNIFQISYFYSYNLHKITVTTAQFCAYKAQIFVFCAKIIELSKFTEYNFVIMKNSIRLEEIAKELNISVTTVSRALSGNGRVSAETRKKVLALADNNNYRSPSQKRMNMQVSSSGQSGNVGIVLSRDLLYESEFFHTCLLGAAASLADHGYETLLILCNTNEYAPLKPAVEKGMLDGVIYTRAIANEKSHVYLKKNSIPVVVIGSGVKDAVMIDSNITLMCRELSSTLVNAGCRNIAFIGGNMGYTVNPRRLEGFLMGISDYSLEPNPNLIFRDISDFETCTTAVETALQRRADGIICCDDVTTIWTYEILTRNGVSVPKDILLASCYDSNDLAHHTPTITAAHVDAKKMGFDAGEVMYRLLSGIESRTFIPVDHTIHLRESTRKL